MTNKFVNNVILKYLYKDDKVNVNKIRCKKYQNIRNYLNKEEILDVIRDYTNMQMKINYKEPIKNYLSIVLLEIDKIKNEIFDINPTNLEVHNIIDKINIDYSNMESNEIIKYVDSILMEIYGLYYKIKFNNISKLKKESYKMRLLK